MATSAQPALVAATPTLLALNSDHDIIMDITVNNGTAAALFLGGATVSAATGLSVAAGGTVRITLAPGDGIFAFSTAGGTISFLSSP